MGTRCATIVRQVTDYGDSQKVEELFRFYRHWDGYPEGHGLAIASAIMAANDDPLKNNRNWCQRVFCRLFAEGADMEVEPSKCWHSDIEYLYAITGHYANYGGKVGVDEFPVIIEVWRSSWDVPYGTTMRKKPLFRGNAQEYVEWVDGGCQ